MDEKEFEWKVKSEVDLEKVMIFVNNRKEKDVVFSKLTALGFHVSNHLSYTKTWDVIAYDSEPKKRYFRLMCTDGYDHRSIIGKKEISFNEFNNLT